MMRVSEVRRSQQQEASRRCDHRTRSVRVETTFDEDNLVPNAGLQVPAALAQKLGVAELVDERVKLPQGVPRVGPTVASRR
jgi:hypothetical protein